MRINEYITHLRNKNIIVTVHGEKLAVHDNDGILTKKIAEELRARKEEIISFFNSTKRKESLTTIANAPVKDHYPLSSVQKRMYFLYEFDKNGVNYNMPAFYKIGRSLDIDKFDKAIKALVHRHQSLRTLFSVQNGHPIQRVVDGNEFEIVYNQIDSKDLDRLVSEFVCPFNLSQDFPYRVSLLDILEDDYLLMIDSHHIINDGVSKDILMSDLLSLYQGDALPALGIQYTDYAVWQQSASHQDLVSKHKEYWLDRFSDDLTTLELPLDYSRPFDLSNKAGVHSLTLSNVQGDQLRSLASSQGVTMYTLFLSLYSVLLSKLSNQTDIIVGTPTAGRHHADLEGMVGMFVNTLALRNQVISEFSFKDFLTNVQEDTLNAFDHQLYPYEKLVDALNLSRDAGRNPLFDVFFSYVQVNEDSIRSSGSNLKIVSHEIPYTLAKFDLEFDVIDKGEINLCFTYRKELFTSSTIARFSDYLLQILDEILNNEERLIKDINILSKEEKDRLLLYYNDTETDYDLNKSVLDMFKIQVQESPDSEALIFENEVITYKELDVRSDLWANHIVNKISKGEIVGLMMSRSPDMITGILAILKSGGAYLPINVEQPTTRTLDILKECEVSLIIGNVENSFESFVGDYKCFTPSALDKLSEKEVFPKISSNDLAYIIYTSGSTGRPKGVMVKHQGVSNLIQHQIELFGMNPEENVLLFSPYYFDASVEQLWLALSSGATLVLFKKEDILDVSRFNSRLKKYSITHLDCTPSFLESIELEEGLNLKRIIVGGEACKLSLASKLSKHYDLYNEYGPTEATVTSTFKKIEQTDILGGKIPIGSPIANTQVYILDNDMNLLPERVVGELYIGGLGITNGYIKNDLLTEKLFVENPFGEGRLYKTGDLARWLPAGSIEFLGRFDDQIELNGVRIELGEIESHLNAFEGIKSSAVNLREIENNKSLVAYFVADEMIHESNLKEHLIDRLPLSMLPSFYIQIDELPVSSTGKLDRRLLPDPEKKERLYEAPSNEIENQMVLLWSNLLQIEIEEISVNDGFFELGGNSLKAISLMNTIFKEVSVKITLKEIFVRQTIREISDYILTVKQLKGMEVDYKEGIKLVL